MALWQFDLRLIPRLQVQDEAGTTPERLSEEAADRLPGAIAHERDAVLSQLISELPLAWSSEAGMRAYGAVDGNRIDVIGEQGLVIDEIRVRFDIRSIDQEFLSRVIAYARAMGSVCLTEELEIVEPDRESLIREFENSTARRFLVDPTAYLDSGGAIDP